MKISKNKLYPLIGLLFIAMLILSGCEAQQIGRQPPTDIFQGTIYNLIGHPIQRLMLWLGGIIGEPNGHGWGLSIFTFFFSMILMPFMLNTSIKSTRQQEKMKALQPQLRLVQNAVKTPNLTQAQTMEINQLSMKVYKENNMSVFGGIGCLPLLIQLPVFMGIYQAVAFSPVIARSTFFSISLSRPSMILTIIATILYFIQSSMMLIGVPPEQKKAMQATAFMNPLITFFISINAPGALALYFLVRGIIIIIQQAITTFIIMPRIKREVDSELKTHPMKQVVTEDSINAIINRTPGTTTADPVEAAKTENLHEEIRKRNAGKQKRNN